MKSIASFQETLCLELGLVEHCIPSRQRPSVNGRRCAPQCCGWRPSIPCAREVVLTAADSACSPWLCPFSCVLLGAVTVWGHCTGHHPNVIVSPCSNPNPCKLHNLMVRSQPLEEDSSASTAKGVLGIRASVPQHRGLTATVTEHS